MTLFDENRVYDNARDFEQSLVTYVTKVSRDLEELVTHVSLRVLDRILDRSPVDTGKFKASNTIRAGGSSPEEGEDVFESFFSGQSRDSRSRQALTYARQKNRGFRWRIRDGVVWIYNMVEYAKYLEQGSSQQAPQGVYRLSVAEFDAMFQQELRRFRYFAP